MDPSGSVEWSSLVEYILFSLHFCFHFLAQLVCEDHIEQSHSKMLQASKHLGTVRTQWKKKKREKPKNQKPNNPSSIITLNTNRELLRS